MIYWPALLGVVAMLLLLAGRAEEAEEARNAVLAISFLGLLPLINALFDWVSLGLTRYFLRRGSDPARRYPAVYGLADLGLALLTLIGLALMTLAGLHFAEQMFRLGGGAPGAIDLQRDLLGPIRDTPGDPNMWWIYAILFSTLLPTAFHFVLALFSLFAAPVTPLAASLARRVSEQGADGFSRFQVAAMLGFSLTLGIALTVAAFALTFIGLPRLGHAGMGLLGLLERFAAWLPTFA